MKILPKSSEIRWNSRNKPIHPCILGGTIQPYFYTSSGARTEYSSGTGQYSTKSSSLVFGSGAIGGIIEEPCKVEFNQPCVGFIP